MPVSSKDATGNKRGTDPVQGVLRFVYARTRAMITLYRPVLSPTAEELEEKLRELALARRVVIVNDGSTEEAGIPAGTSLPAIEEGGRFYGGDEAARAYMEDLEREIRQGRQFQSDACYLDPDHPDRCL